MSAVTQESAQTSCLQIAVGNCTTVYSAMQCSQCTAVCNTVQCMQWCTAVYRSAVVRSMHFSVQYSAVNALVYCSVQYDAVGAVDALRCIKVEWVAVSSEVHCTVNWTVQ